MVKVGVITNPGSHKNKTDLAGLEALIARWPGVSHTILGGMAELPAVMHDFADKDIELLVLSGGDGTVQAAFTTMFNDKPFATPPLMALLSRGQTNMTAADIGIGGRKWRGLARLLESAASPAYVPRVATRRILCVENAKGCAPQYGMFFGAAGICRAIEYCRARVHPYNFNASLTSAFTLAILMGQWALGRDKQGLFRGDEIAIECDGESLGSQSCLLVLATTLDRLVLKSRPFWNGTAGGMHYTMLGHPPDRLLANVTRILYGWPNRNLSTPGYVSGDARGISLKLTDVFTIDGNLFEPTPGKELLLSSEQELGFVQI